MNASGASTLGQALVAILSQLDDEGSPGTLSVPVERLEDPLDFFTHVPRLDGARVALMEDDLDRCVVGVGVAAHCIVPAPADERGVQSALEACRSEVNGAPWVGAIRFDPAREPDALWAEDGASWWVRPRLALVQDADCARLLLERPVDVHSRQRLRAALSGQVASTNSDQPHDLETYGPVEPSELQWHEHVAQALAAFANPESRLEKVVLARRMAIRLGAPPDAVEVLRALRAQAGAGTAFLLQRSANHAFVGVTPELLARRSADLLQTEALAGTRPRGVSALDDRANVAALLTSEKDRQEHCFVVRFIEQQLEKAGAVNLQRSEVGVRTLKRLHHLHATITTALTAERSFADVAIALHPTPAVAGTPREEALAFIREHEGFDRGLYAGAVGRLGGETDALYVGIRSLLLQDSTAFVFAGAGLVPGSNAAQEWREVDDKSRGAELALRALLNEADHAA